MYLLLRNPFKSIVVRFLLQNSFAFIGKSYVSFYTETMSWTENGLKSWDWEPRLWSTATVYYRASHCMADWQTRAVKNAYCRQEGITLLHKGWTETFCMKRDRGRQREWKKKVMRQTGKVKKKSWQQQPSQSTPHTTAAHNFWRHFFSNSSWLTDQLTASHFTLLPWNQTFLECSTTHKVNQMGQVGKREITVKESERLFLQRTSSLVSRSPKSWKNVGKYQTEMWWFAKLLSFLL